MSGKYEIVLQVDVGPADRTDSIVSCPLAVNNLLWHEGHEGKLNVDSVEVRELRPDGSEAWMPAQYGDDELHWIMSGNTKSGESRTFVMRFNTDKPVKGKLRTKGLVILTDMGNELLATVDERKLCSYRYRDVWKPYFHPVYGPDGIVTRGELFDTEDHSFHHGIWLAYGSMEAEGTNLWAESDKIVPRRGMTGSMEHETFEHIRYGKVFAEFRERLIYRKPDGHPFARETRTIRIYAPCDQTQLIDWHIRLEEPDDKGPRSMIFAARVAPSMRIRDLSNRNQEHPMGIPLDNPGKIESGTAWVDFSGPVGQGWNGIALFDSPSNPDFPMMPKATEYGMLHGLSRPYPSTSECRGGAAYLKHRAFIHAGDAAEGKVEHALADYVHPARVHVADFNKVSES